MRKRTPSLLILPSLFLPDKTYYASDHPNGAQLIGVFFDMAVQLLELAGKEKSQAEAITEQAVAI